MPARGIHHAMPPALRQSRQSEAIRVVALPVSLVYTSLLIFALYAQMSAGHLGLFNQWNEESPEWKVSMRSVIGM
jgi:hypothetical protein